MEPSVLTGAVVIAAVIKLVIDRVRGQWPTLDGTLVNLSALVLGYLATFIPDVVDGAVTGWVSRVGVALGLTGLSSWFADLARNDYSPGQ